MEYIFEVYLEVAYNIVNLKNGFLVPPPIFLLHINTCTHKYDPYLYHHHSTCFVGGFSKKCPWVRLRHLSSNDTLYNVLGWLKKAQWALFVLYHVLWLFYKLECISTARYTYIASGNNANDVIGIEYFVAYLHFLMKQKIGDELLFPKFHKICDINLFKKQTVVFIL